MEGVYRGTMRVKLGPVTTEYTGAATLEDADEDEWVATFRVQGREARGHGTATATITNRLVPEEEGATRVIVETDLAITGTVGDRTLSFTAPGLTGVTSNTITMTAGAPSQLTLTTQPSTTAPSGVPFAQQPALQLRDAADNPVGQSGVVITAEIGRAHV